jgi:hypothetical protein
LVEIRVPDLLEIPISHALCENTNDVGHGHSRTMVNYVLQANLIDVLGGDDDPLPLNCANPYPKPNLPFGGIWADVVQDNNDNNANNANVAHDVAPLHLCRDMLCHQLKVRYL